ncbi:MAG: hypothetical protein DMD36_06080 [Gemmatimonadetes bacterium]|nr:MAG: hypothetical protein DMD36_06080 [Gemmatimonadota bacterium]
MAVRSVARELGSLRGMGDDEIADRMRLAIRSANGAIFGRTLTEHDKRGMGTTVTALVLYGTRFLIGQVGDSRGYLFRDEKLVQLTKDHSYVQEQVDAGYLTPEQARSHPYSNVITRCAARGRAARVRADRRCRARDRRQRDQSERGFPGATTAGPHQAGGPDRKTSGRTRAPCVRGAATGRKDQQEASPAASPEEDDGLRCKRGAHHSSRSGFRGHRPAAPGVASDRAYHLRRSHGCRDHPLGERGQLPHGPRAGDIRGGRRHGRPRGGRGGERDGSAERGPRAGLSPGHGRR